MQKRRFEILLPIMHNDGRPVDPQKFLRTREKLIARFGAISQLPGTIAGVWTHEGTRFEDQSLRLYVDAEDSVENREYFSSLKEELKSEFEQIEIYIVSYPIEII